MEAIEPSAALKRQSRNLIASAYAIGLVPAAIAYFFEGLLLGLATAVIWMLGMHLLVRRLRAKAGPEQVPLKPPVQMSAEQQEKKKEWLRCQKESQGAAQRLQEAYTEVCRQAAEAWKLTPEFKALQAAAEQAAQDEVTAFEAFQGAKA